MTCLTTVSKGIFLTKI